MTTFPTAYGLTLRSSIPLPGMRPSARSSALYQQPGDILYREPAGALGQQPGDTATGLPELELEEVSVRKLLATWSGAAGGPIWAGEVGDGLPLQIERGVAGDVLFAYAEQAYFRLNSSGERLECGRLAGGLQWLQVLLCRVLPDVAMLRGYEALHASAVDTPHGAIALLAAPGTGKSTLALELVRRGFGLLADDVLVLGAANGEVLAFPGTPHVNLAEDALTAIDPASVGEVWNMAPGERWVELREVVARPRPVALVCLLEHTPDATGTCTTLAAAPLALGPYMLGLSSERARERARFHLYSDLVQGARLLRLTRGERSTPAELADRLETALEDIPSQNREPALATGTVG